MAEFPAFPLWTDAYLGDTTHLNVTEHGAYLLLLMTAWRTSDCALPDDDRLLARYARCEPRQWKKLRPVIEPFFVVENGKWRQGRLTDERETIQRKREIAAANGKASALKRKGRHAAERKPHDSGARTEREPSENLTISTDITPLSPKNEKPTKRAIPDGFEPQPFGAGTEAAQISQGWSKVELDRQLERFKDHHRLKGNRFSDWQAAWGQWVRNSVTFGNRGSGDRREHGFRSGDLVESILAEHGKDHPP